jgi:phosphoribosylformylglycinamidine synthase II
VIDTVGRAGETPDAVQPFAALGLTADEYVRIREILGRRPTSSELAMYSVMWSEHCSYKSSKTHFGYFGETMTEKMREHLMVGIGENAGVVDIGDGWAVTFKVESHNHPSYVEPHQGAATGVGGIVRDIMAMGARPIAVMDQLRFGAIDHPDTPRVVHGVVSGIGSYGNCLGLPNIGGELVFDSCYQGNPLVNALCIGVMRHEDIHLANASGAGNLVVLFGAKTGGDGIGGASLLASDTFADGGPSKRPAVQVGDPFAEKVLIECCLDLYRADVVNGISDLGAAGLSCALSELASNGDGGMRAWLERAPLRDSTLAPEEILMSESQERMMAVVEPAKLDAFLAVTGRWEVEATVIGEVTDTGRLQITWNDELICDVPPRSVAHDGPVYQRPIARPDYQDALQASGSAGLTRPATADELRSTLLAVTGSPNQADKSWVTDQYDRYVMGNTASAMPDDAGVLRIDEATGLGVALATDCNARYAKLDPYVGAQFALAEAYRNVAASGARPLAVTDCMNFGSPEDPGVMWQFTQALHGLADGCAVLGTPVTGGNVSFYNQTGTAAIHPTPVVGMLGVLADVARRTPSSWREPGSTVLLLGTTRAELDGSAWAEVVHQHLGGTPPRVDFAAEQALAEVLIGASEQRLLRSAHDLADGGLAQTLVESALRFDVGVSVELDGLTDAGVSPFEALFSESGARAVVTLDPRQATAFEALCAEHDVPVLHLGQTTDDATLTVADQFAIALDELAPVWRSPLRDAFAG